MVGAFEFDSFSNALDKASSEVVPEKSNKIQKWMERYQFIVADPGFENAKSSPVRSLSEHRKLYPESTPDKQFIQIYDTVDRTARTINDTYWEMFQRINKAPENQKEHVKSENDFKALMASQDLSAFRFEGKKTLDKPITIKTGGGEYETTIKFKFPIQNGVGAPPAMEYNTQKQEGRMFYPDKEEKYRDKALSDVTPPAGAELHLKYGYGNYGGIEFLDRRRITFTTSRSPDSLWSQYSTDRAPPEAKLTGIYARHGQSWFAIDTIKAMTPDRASGQEEKQKILTGAKGKDYLLGMGAQLTTLAWARDHKSDEIKQTLSEALEKSGLPAEIVDRELNSKLFPKHVVNTGKGALLDINDHKAIAARGDKSPMEAFGRHLLLASQSRGNYSTVAAMEKNNYHISRSTMAAFNEKGAAATKKSRDVTMKDVGDSSRAGRDNIGPDRRTEAAETARRAREDLRKKANHEVVRG